MILEIFYGVRRVLAALLDSDLSLPKIYHRDTENTEQEEKKENPFSPEKRNGEKRLHSASPKIPPYRRVYETTRSFFSLARKKTLLLLLCVLRVSVVDLPLWQSEA